MEIDANKINETKCPSSFGDRSTSDVVVRLRTQEGRDDWFYCHSHILIEKSKYFAERLSEDWPTCQILDSRNCVEIYCEESEFNHQVTVLRLLYADSSVPNTWHSVRTALGTLQVAIKLGCQQMICACVEYLEAVPWEEAEEEEILKIIPCLGTQAEPILARLQPVNPTSIIQIFLSAIGFATSSPPTSMNDLKFSTQEQLEYMLTEDDDAPLVTDSDEIKSEVKHCVSNLLIRFYSLLELGQDELKERVIELHFLLSDLSWICQILAKLEIIRELVESWVESSEKILKAVNSASPCPDMLESMVKVTEVAAKVLEAIAYGTVILPTAKRLQMVKLWLPFARDTKPTVDSMTLNEETPLFKMDADLWQSLESAFVSIVLALPSEDQAGILTEWLESKHVRYPDLTEAFEVWCYRSKVARRRLESMGVTRSVTSSSTIASSQSPSDSLLGESNRGTSNMCDEIAEADSLPRCWNCINDKAKAMTILAMDNLVKNLGTDKFHLVLNFEMECC